MPEDELSVEVTVTPRQSRNLAVAVAVASVAVIILPFVTESTRLGNPVLGLGGLVYALHLAHRARKGVTVTTLRIDRVGLTTESGLHDCTWDRAILIWVGFSWGCSSQPQLLIYTRAGVSFARLSRLSGVRVVDGTVVSRRRTEQELLDSVPT